MFDVVLSVRDKLRYDIEALDLWGVSPKLYVGSVKSDAVVPYGWIRRSSEAPYQATAVVFETLVYLDLWGRSSQEIQLLENAAAFLDDYNPPPYGNAGRIRYVVQSKTQLSEDENREHSTALYAVRYVDLRKTI